MGVEVSHVHLEHVFARYDTTGVRAVQKQAWSYGEGDDCRSYDVTFNSEKRLLIKVAEATLPLLNAYKGGQP